MTGPPLERRFPRRVLFFLAALAIGWSGLLSAPASSPPVLWPRVPAAAAAANNTVTLGAIASSERFIVQARRQDTAERTLRYAEAAHGVLAPRFVSVPDAPVIITVVEDRKEYERIEPASSTRGFATFGGNRVYLLGDQLDQEVVTHELTHIYLGKNVRPGLHVPDWFNEGLAQYASGSTGPTAELIYVLGTGDILPLAELGQIDALHDHDRQLATVQGLAVVQFLANEYGDSSVWSLVEQLGRARTFGQALLDTYGRTDLQLDAQWMAYAKDRYGLLGPEGLRLLASAGLGLLALVAAGVWFVRRAMRLRPAPSEVPLTSQEIAEAERACADLDPRAIDSAPPPP